MSTWKFMRLRVATVAVGLAGLLCATSGLAQLTPAGSGVLTYEEQVAKRRQHQALDESLFGDKVHLQDGTVRFMQDDIVVPLNSGLRMSLGRKTRERTRSYHLPSGVVLPQVFGDWELDVPFMRAVFDTRDGWNGGTVDGRRCSAGGFVPRTTFGATTDTSGMVASLTQYWGGIGINLPGQATQQLLKPTPGQQFPTDGRTYVATTKQQSRISCLPALKNSSGEGFAVTTAEGVTYHFDWLVARPVDPLMVFTKPYPQNVIAPLSEIYLYASRVTDRFGNALTYRFDTAKPNQLMSIEASEGARIDIVYNAEGRIASATTGGRQWTYAYSNKLSSITLPDQSRWTFEDSSQGVVTSTTSFLIQPYWDNVCRYAGGGSGSASSGYGVIPPAANWVATVSMTHPSGAKGRFVFHVATHGTVEGPGRCFVINSFFGTSAFVEGVPSAYAVFSIASKTISGPGLSPHEWRYNYEDTWSFSCAGVTNCATSTSKTTVTRNDGLVRRYWIGNNYSRNLGQLIAETHERDGVMVQRKDYTYHTPTLGQAFPQDAGAYPLPPNVTTLSTPMFGNPFDVKHRPLVRTVTTVDGVALNRTVNGFDRFVRPTSVAKANAAYNKTETTEYYDDISKWVIGQVSRRGTNGVESLRVEYGANSKPYRIYTFGSLQETLGYSADGTLSLVTNGNGYTTTLSGWKRGVPQSIAYPPTPEATSGSLSRATVDDNGWITSVTSEAGTATCYGYDGMGRISAIYYPSEAALGSCDGTQSRWYATTISFAPENAVAYGIAPGHWKRTERTGNAYTVTYYDALWRPLVEDKFDAANAGGTRSTVVSQYALNGKVAFTSYPQRAVSDYTQALAGTRTYYDAIDRVVTLDQDSELGTLRTSTAYLANFQRRVTNPRGQATTFAYRLFDDPADADIVAAWAPEGATLSIMRDVFGKPLSISRSGPGVSATRSYVYDGFQRLCKTIEPETGATVQAYDGAGNLAWRASGLALAAANSCDHGSVSPDRQILFGYDARDRLTATNYGDGSPGIGRNYTPDGLLNQTWSGGSTWTYGYNNRRLRTSETLSFGGANYGLGWGHDAHGNVASLTYPDGTGVTYAPDALGRPTQVSGFASGVWHHPNGLIGGYTLANGVAHSTSQTTRGLPALWRDAGVVQDAYAYDANANVTAITDQQEGVNSRSMGYDGLDRLVAANGPWGTGSYGYDALDNLRSSTVGSRSVVAALDATTNRLSSLTVNGAVQGFGYDANGNLTSRGGQSFSFDIGNRLQSAAGRASYSYDGHGRRTWVAYADGTTKVQVYSQSGKLLWTGHNSQGSTKHVYLGERLIAEVNSATGVSYSHTDALGSPVARTNASAQIVGRTRYEPYGATAAGTNPTGIGFTGHVNDSDTGLVYMQQRYYEPLAGRFLSVDPVTTNIKTGAQFNRYAYVDNNPYKFKDPDGRFGVLGFVIGAGVEASAQLITTGSINNPVGVFVSGVSGALTGGVGGALSKAAVTGAITAREATVGTTVAAAAIGVAAKGLEGGLKGQKPSDGELVTAGIGNALGGAVGAKITNAALAKAEQYAAKSGVTGGIGDATVSAIQQGGKAEVRTSFGGEIGKIASETSVAVIQNQTQR
jgi:RHS repeat-associated protein